MFRLIAERRRRRQRERECVRRDALQARPRVERLERRLPFDASLELGSALPIPPSLTDAPPPIIAAPTLRDGRAPSGEPFSDIDVTIKLGDGLQPWTGPTEVLDVLTANASRDFATEVLVDGTLVTAYVNDFGGTTHTLVVRHEHPDGTIDPAMAVSVVELIPGGNSLDTDIDLVADDAGGYLIGWSDARGYHVQAVAGDGTIVGQPYSLLSHPTLGATGDLDLLGLDDGSDDVIAAWHLPGSFTFEFQRLASGGQPAGGVKNHDVWVDFDITDLQLRSHPNEQFAVGLKILNTLDSTTLHQFLTVDFSDRAEIQFLVPDSDSVGDFLVNDVGDWIYESRVTGGNGVWLTQASPGGTIFDQTEVTPDFNFPVTQSSLIRTSQGYITYAAYTDPLSSEPWSTQTFDANLQSLSPPRRFFDANTGVSVAGELTSRADGSMTLHWLTDSASTLQRQTFSDGWQAFSIEIDDRHAIINPSSQVIVLNGLNPDVTIVGGINIGIGSWELDWDQIDNWQFHGLMPSTELVLVSIDDFSLGQTIASSWIEFGSPADEWFQFRSDRGSMEAGGGWDTMFLPGFRADYELRWIETDERLRVTDRWSGESIAVRQIEVFEFADGPLWLQDADILPPALPNLEWPIDIRLDITLDVQPHVYPATTLAVSSSGSDSRVRSVQLVDGRLLHVFVGENATGMPLQLIGRIGDANGSPAGPALMLVAVAAPDSEAVDWDVHGDADGGFTVVWRDAVSLRSQRFNSEVQSVGPESILGSPGLSPGFELDTVRLDSGETAVAWLDPDSGEAWLVILDDDAVPTAAAELIAFRDGGESLTGLQIIHDDVDEFVVAYRFGSPFTLVDELVFSPVNRESTPSPMWTIDAESYIDSPTVTPGPDDGIWVSGLRSIEGRFELTMSLLDRDGTERFSVVLESDIVAPAFPVTTEVVQDEYGLNFVSYPSSRLGSVPLTVVQVINVDGGRIEQPIELSPVHASFNPSAQPAAMVPLAGGGVFASWTGWDSQMSADVAFGRPIRLGEGSVEISVEDVFGILDSETIYLRIEDEFPNFTYARGREDAAGGWILPIHRLPEIRFWTVYGISQESLTITIVDPAYAAPGELPTAVALTSQRHYVGTSYSDWAWMDGSFGWIDGGEGDDVAYADGGISDYSIVWLESEQVHEIEFLPTGQITRLRNVETFSVFSDDVDLSADFPVIPPPLTITPPSATTDEIEVAISAGASHDGWSVPIEPRAGVVDGGPPTIESVRLADGSMLTLTIGADAGPGLKTIRGLRVSDAGDVLAENVILQTWTEYRLATAGPVVLSVDATADGGWVMGYRDGVHLTVTRFDVAGVAIGQWIVDTVPPGDGSVAMDIAVVDGSQVVAAIADANTGLLTARRWSLADTQVGPSFVVADMPAPLRIVAVELTEHDTADFAVVFSVTENLPGRSWSYLQAVTGTTTSSPLQSFTIEGLYGSSLRHDAIRLNDGRRVRLIDGDQYSGNLGLSRIFDADTRSHVDLTLPLDAYSFVPGGAMVAMSDGGFVHVFAFQYPDTTTASLMLQRYNRDLQPMGESLFIGDVPWFGLSDVTITPNTRGDVDVHWIDQLNTNEPPVLATRRIGWHTLDLTITYVDAGSILDAANDEFWIAGIPDETALTAGRRIGDQLWAVHRNDLHNLQLVSPEPIDSLVLAAHVVRPGTDVSLGVRSIAIGTNNDDVWTFDEFVDRIDGRLGDDNLTIPGKFADYTGQWIAHGQSFRLTDTLSGQTWDVENMETVSFDESTLTIHQWLSPEMPQRLDSVETDNGDVVSFSMDVLPDRSARIIGRRIHPAGSADDGNSATPFVIAVLPNDWVRNHTATHLAAVARPGGGYAVAWHGPAGLRYQAFNELDVPVGTEVELDPTPSIGDEQRFDALAVANDRFMVAWVDAAGRIVRVNLLDDNGLVTTLDVELPLGTQSDFVAGVELVDHAVADFGLIATTVDTSTGAQMRHLVAGWFSSQTPAVVSIAGLDLDVHDAVSLDNGGWLIAGLTPGAASPEVVLRHVDATGQIVSQRWQTYASNQIVTQIELSTALDGYRLAAAVQSNRGGIAWVVQSYNQDVQPYAETVRLGTGAVLGDGLFEWISLDGGDHALSYLATSAGGESESRTLRLTSTMAEFPLEFVAADSTSAGDHWIVAGMPGEVGLSRGEYDGPGTWRLPPDVTGRIDVLSMEPAGRMDLELSRFDADGNWVEMRSLTIATSDDEIFVDSTSSQFVDARDGIDRFVAADIHAAYAAEAIGAGDDFTLTHLATMQTWTLRSIEEVEFADILLTRDQLLSSGDDGSGDDGSGDDGSGDDGSGDDGSGDDGSGDDGSGDDGSGDDGSGDDGSGDDGSGDDGSGDDGSGDDGSGDDGSGDDGSGDDGSGDDGSGDDGSGDDGSGDDGSGDDGLGDDGLGDDGLDEESLDEPPTIDFDQPAENADAETALDQLAPIVVAPTIAPAASNRVAGGASATLATLSVASPATRAAASLPVVVPASISIPLEPVVVVPGAAASSAKSSNKLTPKLIPKPGNAGKSDKTAKPATRRPGPSRIAEAEAEAGSEEAVDAALAAEGDWLADAELSVQGEVVTETDMLADAEPDGGPTDAAEQSGEPMADAVAEAEFAAAGDTGAAESIAAAPVSPLTPLTTIGLNPTLVPHSPPLVATFVSPGTINGDSLHGLGVFNQTVPWVTVTPVKLPSVASMGPAATPFISRALPIETTFDSGELFVSVEDIHSKVEIEAETIELVTGTAAVVATGLSVAQIAWLLRGTALMTKLLTSMPIWISFDPLPILAEGVPGRGNSPTDDESLLDIAQLQDD